MLGAHWFVSKCVGPGNQPCSYETTCNKSYAYGLPVRMLWERSCSYTSQLLKKLNLRLQLFAKFVGLCESGAGPDGV
jgi:hypothetical protein